MSIRCTANGQTLDATAHVITTTSDWAFTCWIRMQSLATPGQAVTFRSNSGGSDYIIIWFDSTSGDLNFQILGVDHQVIASIANQTWTFVGVVYDSVAKTVSVYASTTTGAVSLVTTVTSVTNFGDANELLMFNDEGGNFRFLGSVLSLKIWQTTLTAIQVANERTLRPKYTTSLNRWLPLLNNAGAVLDWSGNGYSMTKTGTFTDQAAMPPFGYGQQRALSMY